ncbi:hypothetical protein PAMA_011535 [Pampus argenteus]
MPVLVAVAVVGGSGLIIPQNPSQMSQSLGGRQTDTHTHTLSAQILMETPEWGPSTSSSSSSCGSLSYGGSCSSTLGMQGAAQVPVTLTALLLGQPRDSLPWQLPDFSVPVCVLGPSKMPAVTEMSISTREEEKRREEKRREEKRREEKRREEKRREEKRREEKRREEKRREEKRREEKRREEKRREEKNMPKSKLGL